MNGSFVPWKEATSHVINQGLHYASAVFEGERAYNGKILHSFVFQGATGILLDRYDGSIQPDSFWLASLLFYPQYNKVYSELSLKERSKIEDPWSSIKNYLLRMF